MDRILVVDDDVELCELVTEYLEPESFEVVSTHDGESGLKEALSGAYKVVVLDVMLPALNGLDVLRRLRVESQVPVIILTARGDDVDRIVGLEIGADDYLPKPFNPRELLARIRAILRRTNAPYPSTASGKVEVADVELDPAARTVHRDSEDIELTSVEFSLLELLMRSAGQVVSREQLAQTVLGRQLMPFDRSVDVHVSKLRKKLGDLPDGGERIRSIRGVGYIYVRPNENR